MKSHRRLWRIGLLAMMIIPIIVFVFLVDIDPVFTYLKSVDLSLGPMTAAWVLLLAGYAVHAVRWRMLLAGKPHFLDTFHAANVGHLVNMVIPAGAGHAARMIVLRQSQLIPIAESASSVAVERWLELIMRLLAFGLAISLGAGLATDGWQVGGTIAVIVGSLIIMWLMIKRKAQIIATWPKQIARLPLVTEEKATEQLTIMLDGLSNRFWPFQ